MVMAMAMVRGAMAAAAAVVVGSGEGWCAHAWGWWACCVPVATAAGVPRVTARIAYRSAR